MSNTIYNGVSVYYASIEIKNIIHEIMLNYLPDTKEKDFISLPSDINLYNTGFFDSLVAVEVVMEIENKLNLQLSDDDNLNIHRKFSKDNIFLVLTQYITPSDI